jgi:Protein of unknown function (DUF2795)
MAQQQAGFIQVQKALAGISYPATKQQLIDHARGKKPDKQIMEALESIPDQEYSGPDQVSKAVAKS